MWGSVGERGAGTPDCTFSDIIHANVPMDFKAMRNQWQIYFTEELIWVCVKGKGRILSVRGSFMGKCSI